MTAIRVTENHMKTGTKGSRKECPIALCIKERFGGDVRVRNTLYSSTPLTSWAKQFNPSKTYTVSNGVKDWVQKFDHGQKVPEITIGVKRDHLYIMNEEYNGSVQAIS